MIGNARRQTRRRRLVPRAKAGTTGELADLRLRKAGFIQRASNTKFPRGLATWSIVAAIVGVAAVSNRCHPAIRCNSGQSCVELVFAVVAAIGRVRPVLRASELRCVDDFVPEAGFTGDREGELAMSIGVAGAVGSDAQDRLSENICRGPRQIRAVGTSAEGDDQRVITGQ